MTTKYIPQIFPHRRYKNKNYAKDDTHIIEVLARGSYTRVSHDGNLDVHIPRRMSNVTLDLNKSLL